MATVTSFTAERMLSIENSTVTGGEVDEDGDLQLITRDGTPINAGSVIGPQGPLPPEFSPGGMVVTDWDQATKVGFYYGVGATNSPVAADGGSGLWFAGYVTRVDSQNRVLIELREARTGVAENTTYRRYFNGTSWTSWTSYIQPVLKTLSGSDDLDTILTTGTYVNDSIANASLGNNYPVLSVAGMLEVFNFSAGTQVHQRFTRRGDHPFPQVWVRSKYQTSAWQTWQLLQAQTTPWTAVSILSGFAPYPGETPMVRLLDGIMYGKGGWATTGISAASTQYTVGTMPAALLPVPSGNRSTAFSAFPNANGTFLIDSTTGNIQIRTNSTISGATYYLFGSAPLYIMDAT